MSHGEAQRSRPLLLLPVGRHPLSVTRRRAATSRSASPRPCVWRAPLWRRRQLPAGEPPRRRHPAPRRGGYAPPLPHSLLPRGRPWAAALAASPVGRRPQHGAPAAAAAAAVSAMHRLACAHRLPWGRGAAAREPTAPQDKRRVASVRRRPAGSAASVSSRAPSLPSQWHHLLPRHPGGQAPIYFLNKHHATGPPRGALHQARAQPPLGMVGR